MVRCWFDALTPKQARIAVVLYRELARCSISLLITTREYMYVREVLDSSGVPYIVVGEYGEDLKSKLRNYAERILELLNILEDFDVAVGFPSPEMHRVAFGLGRPIITLTDTPQAYHVSKLTLPLSTYVIVPSIFPETALRRYVPADEMSKVIRFDGLFEVMWIKRCITEAWTKGIQLLKELDVSSGEFAIFRPEESKAAYYRYGSKVDVTVNIVRRLLSEGLKVLVFPRYKDQMDLLKSYFRDEIRDGKVVLVHGRPLDLVLLYPHARLVVTGGLTMATEAALLGTPSLTYFPEELGVCHFLRRFGLPIVHVYDTSAVGEALRQVLQFKRLEINQVRYVLEQIEDPTYVIVDKVRELAGR